MSDGASLLAYCHRHPDDDQARLVYADWLEENGDQARAEFVRVQVRRAALWPNHPDDGPLARRENELLKAHEKRWRASLPKKYRQQLWFRRGLPTHLSASAAQLLDEGPAMRRELPVDSIKINDKFGGRLVPILAAGTFDGLHHLDLTFAEPSDEEMIAFAARPGLSELRTLDLTGDDFGEEACRALARSPHLARLTTLRAAWGLAALAVALGEEGVTMRPRRLQICCTRDESIGLAPLAKGPAFAGVEELDVGGNALGKGGPAALAASAAMPRLRCLSLWGCYLKDGAVRDLFQGDRAGSLERLRLLRNPIGPDAARALASASCLGNLLDLDLSETVIGNDGLAALADARSLGRLLRLNVANAGVSDEGLIALGRSPLLPRLRELNLDNNPSVRGRGWRGLFGPLLVGGLERLDCSRVRLGDEGAKALAESPGLRSLRVLVIRYAEVGPEGAAALARSPHLTGLHVLAIDNNRIGDAGVEALADSPLMDRLTDLSARTNRLTKTAKARWDPLESTCRHASLSIL